MGIYVLAHTEVRSIRWQGYGRIDRELKFSTSRLAVSFVFNRDGAFREAYRWAVYRSVGGMLS